MDRSRRKRAVRIAVGVVVALLLGAVAFVFAQARPMLSPELRREDAFEQLAARGASDVEPIDAPFDGTTVRAYVTSGAADAPLVLFVHGSPGDWTDFVGQLADPALRDAARLASMDRLGYGGSDFGDPVGSMARQARAVIAVLDRLDVARAVLVGHSLGGPVVARTAMDFPERVGGLVLVGSSADPALEETPWYQTVASWPIARPLLPAMIDVCNQEILPHRDELEAMADRWASIVCPVVIVHGTQDVLVPVENVGFMAARVRPDLLRVRRVDDMNHFVPWTHPGVLRAAVLEALEASRVLRAAG